MAPKNSQDVEEKVLLGRSASVAQGFADCRVCFLPSNSQTPSPCVTL